MPPFPCPYCKTMVDHVRSPHDALRDRQARVRDAGTGAIHTCSMAPDREPDLPDYYMTKECVCGEYVDVYFNAITGREVSRTNHGGNNNTAHNHRVPPAKQRPARPEPPKPAPRPAAVAAPPTAPTAPEPRKKKALGGYQV